MRLAIADFLPELQATTREYWSHLLHMIRLFREAVTNEVVIATTNVGHLSQFVNAREWREIH